MKTGRKNLYDWDNWFAEEEFTILKSRHYLVPQSTMAGQIRNAASARGLTIHLEDISRGFNIKVTRLSGGKRDKEQERLFV